MLLFFPFTGSQQELEILSLKGVIQSLKTTETARKVCIVFSCENYIFHSNCGRLRRSNSNVNNTAQLEVFTFI